MDIVVCGIVASDELKRVEGETVAAVVVDGFDGATAEEEHCLACGEACEEVCEASTGCVEEEALDGVVVESTEGVGDVETVMAGVECCC